MTTPSSQSLKDEPVLAPKVHQDTSPTEDVASLSDLSTDSKDGFKPGWRFYAAFTSLSVITLMAGMSCGDSPLRQIWLTIV